VNKRALMIFVLLHVIGIFLFAFGTVDGPWIRATSLEVGTILLLPSVLVTFVFFEPLRFLNFLENWAFFPVFAALTTAMNYAIWLGVAHLIRFFRRKPSADRLLSKPADCT
jgi:hypothetical protein